MLVKSYLYIFLFFFMACTCRGCHQEFDSRRALSVHKRACSSKITDAVATSLEKRKHNRETQRSAKIRRQEDAAAALIARQGIREGFTEPGLPLVR